MWPQYKNKSTDINKGDSALADTESQREEDVNYEISLAGPMNVDVDVNVDVDETGHAEINLGDDGSKGSHSDDSSAG